MNINHETDTMIQVEKLLMLNYKRMEISDDEVVILLLTHTLLKTGNTFINPSDLSLFSSFSVTKIDVLFTNLISKGFIQTIVGQDGSVKTDLSFLYQKLNSIYLKDLQKQIKTKEVKEAKEDKNSVFILFEKFFGRPLSPLEYDIINGWIEKKYTYQEIERAVQLCSQSPNHSIRYIDSILFEEHKKKEIGEMEYQSQLQETIELSKIDWLNK